MAYKFNPLIGVGLDDVGAGGGGASIDYQEFTSNGTWTKPAGVTWVEVEVIGGGGGGGSGNKSASTTIPGGTGGWGSPISRWIFAASGIGSTESVTIGAGGTGGASQATNSTIGNDGTDGGVSSFGAHINSGYGTRGLASTSNSMNALANEVPYVRWIANNAGCDVNNPGHCFVGVIGRLDAGLTTDNWCGAGGAGGWRNSATFSRGGRGGWGTSSLDSSDNYGETEGQSAPALASGSLRGGGGGACSLTGNAGNGASGSVGGGGGGGGASIDSTGDSGAGGNGGNGRVRIWAW